MAGNLILERFDVVEGFAPVDIGSSGAAANGDWVSTKGALRVAIVFIDGVGTAGQDPTLTVTQSTNVLGSDEKALTFTTIYRKQAATSLAATTAWTKTTQTAANTYTHADAAEQDLAWVVEIDPVGDMDVANGFEWLRATVANVGANAQLATLQYIVEKVYRTAPASQPSNIS